MGNSELSIKKTGVLSGQAFFKRYGVGGNISGLCKEAGIGVLERAKEMESISEYNLDELRRDLIRLSSHRFVSLCYQSLV